MRDQCSVTAMILSVMTTVSDCTSYTTCHGCVTSDMNVKYPWKNESDFEIDNLDEIHETGTDKIVNSSNVPTLIFINIPSAIPDGNMYIQIDSDLTKRKVFKCIS
jgi:hypothetical protein